MIMIYFPKTLGGVSFEKAGKLFGGKETIFFDKTQIAASLAICLILPLFPKERPKGTPLWKPQTYVFLFIFYFCY